MQPSTASRREETSIMFQRALVLGTAVVAVLVSSAASATTEPPTTAPATTRSRSSTPRTSRSPTTATTRCLTIGSADTAETFVLVQRGAEPPALDGELAGATVIEVPIETMFSESSSHYGFIDVLDIEDDGHRRRRHLARRHAELAERAAAGEIESFAPELRRRPRARRGRRSGRVRHRWWRRPGARGDRRRRDPRRAQPRVAGDDARKVGRSGSACSPP